MEKKKDKFIKLRKLPQRKHTSIRKKPFLYTIANYFQSRHSGIFPYIFQTEDRPYGSGVALYEIFSETWPYWRKLESSPQTNR